VVVQSVQNGQRSLQASQKLIDAVSGMLAGATQSVTQASQDMNVIAESAKEQTAASNSIARNMEQIAQMVEESSAAAREVAGAAGQLKQLATRLQGSTLRFKFA
jgi:methyl-accepting chemotaxis protein